ncbi:MAG: hypothetical protein QM755_02760 [Luteolibacter sp.]
MHVTLSFSETFSSRLRELATGIGQKQSLLQTLAGALRSAIVDHITTVKVPRQTPGIEYWQQAAKSIDLEAAADEATLTFTQRGISLHYYGGEVRPVKARALAIPTAQVPIKGGSRVRPAAAGLLAFISAAKGRETVGYLVSGRAKTASRGRNKGRRIIAPIPRNEGGKLFYVLRTVTRHHADSSFLPTDQRIAQLLLSSAASFIGELD